MGAFEYLWAAFNLDFGFLIDVVMANLLWVFLFIAAGYFFSEGKAPLKRALILLFLVITSIDIFHLIHFSIYTATGLAILYFLRVPVLIFVEKTKGLSKYFALAWLATWFIAITIVAFGM